MTEKLDLKSLNITEERKKQLKQIFPEIFTENKIDFDKLKMALGDEVEENPERYEMNWAGKKEAFKQVQIPSIGTLRPCREESVNFDETENIYIEGDNLEVLKLLQKSYFGKIKMIYIDPPYNTGKDFIYKDNFKDNLQNYLELTGQVNEKGKRMSANQETSGRYHSNWLNMMYPRLFLARNLLRDDGVIFISIDDNEVHNLRKICDEIFGEENFVAYIIRQEKAGAAHDSKDLAIEYDYVICYKKTSITKLNREPVDIENDKKYRLEDEFVEERGKYYLRDFDYRGSYSQSLDYPIVLPNGKEIWAGGKQGEPNTWRWSKEKFEWGVKNKFIVFRESKIYIKQYQFVDNEGNFRERNLPFRGLTKFLNSEGTQDLTTLKLNPYFSFPKPISMLKYLLKIGSKKDSIILDFFSGSATTAHAVMQLNAEDGGKRKYIMVQIPELTDENSEAYKAGYKNICEIGKERIRRAGAKINEELKNKNLQLKIGEEAKENQNTLDIGFKVLKLDTSNFKEWNNTPDNIAEQISLLKENIKDDRTQEDILYEIILKSGLSLSEKIEIKEIQDKKVYSIMSGFLIICLEKDLNLEFIRSIAELKPAKFVCLDISFHNNDQLKTNAVQIMKSIKYDGENSIEFKTV